MNLGLFITYEVCLNLSFYFDGNQNLFVKAVYTEYNILCEENTI